MADTLMLGRVLAIVLENASKYAGKAAMVSVSSETVDGKVQIFIDDTGLGFPSTCASVRSYRLTALMQEKGQSRGWVWGCRLQNPI